MPAVERLMLIDHDTYESKNVAAQEITESQVNQRKVVVQARRVRKINPSLDVVAVPDAVENLPLGLLRADLMLACLDSRRSRQYVNAAARHLGMPWIDAGVSVGDGGSLLARVTVYLPGDDRPCLECAWDDGDYDVLEQDYPCIREQLPSPSLPATSAPSGLGALAASLQAIECQRLLSGKEDRSGRQILLDAEYQTHSVTTYQRQPECRLSDHDAWAIHRHERRPADLSLGQAFEFGRDAAAENGDRRTLRVEGRTFERRATCTGCGRIENRLRLRGAFHHGGRQCRHCGRPMVAAGFDRADSLDLAALSRRDLVRSLRGLGVRVGDILRISGPEGDTHHELAGPPEA
jgi:adenylyltransferase/sulfurtransferase